MKKRLLSFLCVSFLAGAVAPARSARTLPPAYDLLIRGGLVIDGTGKKARAADVAISDGKIVKVGSLARETAREVFDAKGLTISPGFIDVHTHADAVASKPLAENYVRMGVTAVIAGNCGESPTNIAEHFRKIQSAGVSVNFATLIGHNSVRIEVMGSARRTPTPAEVARMRALVTRAMADGAVGFSTGLQYIPGAYAEPEEILDLAKVAARAGGIYASHMRNEGTELEKALAETIRVGESAGCPIEVSHIKIDSPRRWGGAHRILAILESARRRGIDVRADMYGYTAGSSGLGIRFPAWALEGEQARINERLDDPATWEKIRAEMKVVVGERGFSDLSWCVVAAYPPDPSINGLSIKDIARKWRNSETFDAQLEVARDMMRAGGAQMVYHIMSEPDVTTFLRSKEISIGSDSSLVSPGEGIPHPRGYGNNARILGRYVREEKVLSLEEAVRRMTMLPALHFSFDGRGQIKEGFAADLVLFKPAEVADKATYANPHQYPVGIPHVLVNGVFVVRDGRHTGAKPGQILRSSRPLRKP